jgi:hypothetical protein
MPLSEVPFRLAPRSEATASSGVPLNETPIPRGGDFVVLPLAGGEVIVCFGGTSEAYAVAQVVDDGEGSLVIEDAVNTACRCPTLHQPLFHRNQLNSCLFVHLLLECQNLECFLGMAKRHKVLVFDRPLQ